MSTPHPIRILEAAGGALLLGSAVACAPENGLKVSNNIPVAVLLSHADGDRVLEDSLISVRGKGSDVDDEASELEGALWAAGAQACDWAPLDDDGIFECDLLVPLLESLTDGRLGIDLEVRDPSGVGATASARLEVFSSEAPIVTIVEPMDGQVAYADQPLFVHGLVTDDLDAPEDIIAEWSTDIEGSVWSTTFDATGAAQGTIELSEGTHLLSLTALDTAGDTTTETVQVEVFATNTEPACTFTAPADGSTGRTDTPTVLEATVSDGEDPSEALSVAFSSDVAGALGSTSADATGRASFEVVDLAVGAHLLTLTVEDSGGATCTDTLTYTIGSPPQVEITAPSDGDVVNVGESVAFAATVSDGEDSPPELGLEWSSDLDGVLDSTPADGAGSAGFSLDSLTRGTHQITLQATDLDGQATAGTIELVVNGLPTAPVVSLSPDPAVTDDALVASIDTVSTDPEGDTVAYSYVWDESGVVSTASVSATLPASATAKGETWTVTVIPTDGSGDGPAGTASVTIDNSPPVLASVSLTPTTATASDTLSCTPGTVTDADGDSVSYSYAWSVGGSSSSETGSTLSSTSFSNGDAVVCTVTPSDGTDSGTAVASNTVIIGNTAPVMSSVTITPTSPSASSTLTCTPSATDADGDSITYSYDWTISGTTVGTSSTLSSGFSSGDTVTCTVTPNDGTDSGSAMADSVSVGNTAPVLSSVSLSPTTATEGDTFTCTPGSATDADGDTISYSYAWFVDSVQVAPTTSTLGDTFWDSGETVYCSVTPSDGTDSGTAVASNSVTVSNSAPSISSVSVSPSSPASSDTLTCSYSGFSDADGDSDASTYSWTISGTEVGTSSTLSSGFSSGDTVTCTVTPYDGTDSGTAVADSVTVLNTAPVMSSVSVTPNTPTVSDTLTCTPSASDADGDTVTYSYDWTIGGTTVGTSSTLSSGFSRGDTVVCTVTPSDGTDSGTAMADSELIENSVPSAGSVTLSPSSPVYSSIMTVSYTTTDGDGDSVSVSHAWFVNSAQVSTASYLTVSSNAVKGDSIYVQLTPTDGYDTGTTVTSSTRTVGNTAPSLPAINATDNPAVGVDDIVCAITSPSSDVDSADTVSYVFEWDADGSVYPDDFGSATGPDTTTYTDDTIPAADTSLATDWTCTVYATDGTDTSGDATDTSTPVSASSSLDTTRQGYTYGSTGSYMNNVPNFAIAEPYTMASSATVTGFGFNWAFGYCTTCELGVYSDSGGPDTLYGEVVSSSCGTNAGGNNEVSGSGGFAVPAGTVWLGWNFASCNYGSNYYIADSGGSTSTFYYVSDTAGDGLPDPWTATSSTLIRDSSVYPIGY